MSTFFLNAAFAATIRPSATKFVLVALADYANEAGESYPSAETLESKTCQDRKTVLAAIARLIEIGAIVDTGERRGRTKQIPVYKLVIDKIKDMATAATQRPHKNSTENGTVPKTEQYRFSGETVPFFPENEGKESQKRDTEPSVYNHQGEPSVFGDEAAKPKKAQTTRFDPALLETDEYREDFRAILQGEGLLSTLSRWNLISGDFVDHWVNTGSNAGKYRKADWRATWQNAVRKQANYHRRSWKAEDASKIPPPIPPTQPRYGLSSNFLEGVDWDRVKRQEG